MNAELINEARKMFNIKKAIESAARLRYSSVHEYMSDTIECILNTSRETAQEIANTLIAEMIAA